MIFCIALKAHTTLTRDLVAHVHSLITNNTVSSHGRLVVLISSLCSYIHCALWMEVSPLLSHSPSGLTIVGFWKSGGTGCVSVMNTEYCRGDVICLQLWNIGCFTHFYCPSTWPVICCDSKHMLSTSSAPGKSHLPLVPSTCHRLLLSLSNSQWSSTSRVPCLCRNSIALISY